MVAIIHALIRLTSRVSCFGNNSRHNHCVYTARIPSKHELLNQCWIDIIFLVVFTIIYRLACQNIKGLTTHGTECCVTQTKHPYSLYHRVMQTLPVLGSHHTIRFIWSDTTVYIFWHWVLIFFNIVPIRMTDYRCGYIANFMNSRLYLLPVTN